MSASGNADTFGRRNNNVKLPSGTTSNAANNDLSLSQSLGGLRIANPDDDCNSAITSRPSPSNPVSPITPTSPNRYPLPSYTNPTSATTRIAPQATISDSSPHNRAQISSSHDQHLIHPPRVVASELDVHSALGYDPSSYLNTSPPVPVSIAPSRQLPSYSPDRHRLAHRQSMPIGQNAQSQQHNLRQPDMSASSQRPDQYDRMRSGPSQSQRPEVGRSVSQAAAAAAAALGGGSSNARAPQTRAAPITTQLSYREPAHPARRSSRPTPGPSDNSYTLRGSQPSTIGTPHLEDSPMATPEEWQDRGAATRTEQMTDNNGRPVTRTTKKGVKDFNFGRTLGEGSYSTVLAATDRQTSREYAIKVLDKRHIIKEKKVKYVNIEKDTLNRLTEHPGIVRLYYTFQDERSLYFVLDLATGGELLGVLKKTTSFDEDCSRFYGAEILDSIDYMHQRGIIHRDLKPENVLLDDQMHVKITDFGTAKILDLSGQSQFGQVSVSNDPMDGADTDKAVSFVGTAEYVSPELLTDKNACKASDLWAFGCIIYQLLAGRPPFKAANEYLTFQKIVALDYLFPDGFPSVARDLVEKLLVLDPSERLPIAGIKRHPFFAGIDWGKGLWKQKPPKLRPFKPYAKESNGGRRVQESTIPSMYKSSSTPSGPDSLAASSSQQSRPKPRVITELAPPTQLDIDWSPVLTKPNERIWKCDKLVVYSTPAPYSPTSKNVQGNETPAEMPSKFSRLFGATTTKKRQRLVMVTSAGQLVLAPSNGDKKEAKLKIDLNDRDVSWKSQPDAKGYTVWCVFAVSLFQSFHTSKN